MSRETETLRNSQTQCHCTNPECVKADSQRHPCGRCVREGTQDVDGVLKCDACADFDRSHLEPTRFSLERLTGLAKRAGILLALVAVANCFGCSRAPKPADPCGARWEQTDEQAEQWEAEREAREWRHARAAVAR